ncbi:serine/arginine repetitive matrix protein 3-like [Sturnira hondurensis]|uniref:serine/arginine repetitive matrix protein 3-like n=1 Tax=Sturnira hondurensis TaxID=192404 RepID=UPI00187A347A|nr:serine/arginine repetitive matrix protein 3-like [Sturnira hondurensis]
MAETLSPKPTEKPLPIPSLGGIRKAGPAPGGHPPAPRTPLCRPSSGSPERGSSSESTSPSPGVPAAVRAPEAEGHGPLCQISECHNSPSASEVCTAPRGRCCARPSALGAQRGGCRRPVLAVPRAAAAACSADAADRAGSRAAWSSGLRGEELAAAGLQPPASARRSAAAPTGASELESVGNPCSGSRGTKVSEPESGRGGSGLGREWSGSQPLAQPTRQSALTETLLHSQPWDLTNDRTSPGPWEVHHEAPRTSARHILKRRELRPWKFLLPSGSAQPSVHCSGLAWQSGHSWRGCVLGNFLPAVRPNPT